MTSSKQHPPKILKSNGSRSLRRNVDRKAWPRHRLRTATHDTPGSCNVAAREGQTDTAVAQKTMGINRERKRGQQQNGSSKRARSATTVSASGRPALATSVAPIAAALSTAQQPLGALDQQMQAPSRHRKRAICKMGSSGVAI
ncbi:hypothetical protein PG984_006523 [Apiospora sp. TS-2023a]